MQMSKFACKLQTGDLKGGMNIHAASGKEPACQCRQQKRQGLDPWVITSSVLIQLALYDLNNSCPKYILSFLLGTD